MDFKKIIMAVVVLPFLFSFTLSLAESLPNEWTPQWEVGDWWIVKVVGEISLLKGEPYPLWGGPTPYRYEVTGIEQVNGKECYVLERRSIGKGAPLGTKRVFYFWKDDLHLVREIVYSVSLGKLQEPRSIDYNYLRGVAFVADAGMGADLSLPAFPLAYEGAWADSLAKPRRNREIATDVVQRVALRKLEDFDQQLADSEMVKIHLDSSCYHVTFEMGGPESKRISFIEELWSPQFPWYLYKEISYKDLEGDTTRKFLGKTWLIDCSSFHK